MSIKPVGFYLVVRPEKDTVEEELGTKVDGGYMTEGGIFVADNTEAVKDAQRDFAAQESGTLIAVGPIAWYDYADRSPWAEVGDIVVYAKYAGKFIEDPDTKEVLILLQDSDIVGIKEVKSTEEEK